MEIFASDIVREAEGWPGHLMRQAPVELIYLTDVFGRRALVSFKQSTRQQKFSRRGPPLVRSTLFENILHDDRDSWKELCFPVKRVTVQKPRTVFCRSSM